ncbi:MAG: hypothetical protein ACOWWR_11650 [Eubacteriales bacterium]
MSKKRSKNNKLFREKMRDKTVGQFLNDQLKETGITDKGDMLSMYNSDNATNTTNNKTK